VGFWVHLGVPEKGAGHGNQLFLACREGGASLRKHHVQAIWMGLHQLGKVGAAQGRPALGVRVVAKGRQVAPESAREQHGCLRPSHTQ